MSTEWFCKLNDREVGPVTLQQIKSMADRGTLRPEDLIRRGETGTWLSAGKVRGLFPSQDSPAAEPTPVSDAETTKIKKASRLPQAESIPVGIPITQDDTIPPGDETIAPIDKLKTLPTKSAKPPQGAARDAGSLAAKVPAASRKPSSKSTPPTKQDDIFAELLATEASVSHRGRRPGSKRSDPAIAVSDLQAVQQRKKKLIKTLLPLAILLGVLGVSAGVYYFGFRSDPAKAAQLAAEKARLDQEAKKKAAAAQLKDDTEDDDLRRAAAAKSGSVSAAAASGSASTAQSGSAAAAESPPATTADAAPAKAAAKAERAWVDASKASAELKEQKLTVKVVSARFGLPPNVRLVAPRGGNNRSPLTVTVVLENNDAHRKTEYQTWSAKGAALRGDFGLPYRQIALPSKEGPKRIVNAGAPQTDYVVFEHPTEIAERYQFELPAEAIGGRGMIRFEIPRTMITGSLDPALEGVTGAQTTAKLFGPKGEVPAAATAETPAGAAAPAKPMEDPDTPPPLEIGGEKVKPTKTRGGLK